MLSTSGGRSLTAAVAVAAIALSPAVTAEPEELSQARSLYQALRYREAYDAFREALVMTGNSPAELAEIYQHLGILAASMGKRREAVAQFQRLLCLDPEAEVDPALPPKVTRPFDAAQRAAGGVRCFELHHQPAKAFPTSGGLELQVELLADSLEMATGIIVAYRSEGQESYKMLRRDGTGALRLSISAAELPPDRDAQYYLRVVNAHGGVLQELGSAAEPMRVAAIKAAAEADPDPWFKNEWVWVVAGAGVAIVVVGGVVAAVVAASSAPSTSVDFGPVEHEIGGGQ